LFFQEFFYTEIILASLGIILSLIIFFINIIKRFAFNLNRLFAIVALLLAILSALHLLQLLNPPFISRLLIMKMYALFLVLQALTVFHLIQIYPDGDIRKRIPYIILTDIPGIAVAAFAFLTDYVVKDVQVDRFINISTGQYVSIYLAVLAFYSIGGTIILFYRYLTLENRAFRRELLYLLLGTILGYSVMLAIIFLWPVLTDYSMYRSNFTYAPQIFLLIIFHHAVYDLPGVDFRQLYLRIFSWILLFNIMALPVAIGLYYIKDLLTGDITAVTAITILIFIYLFITYRILKPRFDNFLIREYSRIIGIINGFFRPADDEVTSDIQDIMWSSYYKSTIYSFKEKFDINRASFFILNKRENLFSLTYNFGEKPDRNSIMMNNDIISCLTMHPHVVGRSLLYNDRRFIPYREIMISFFDLNKYEAALPFLNQEGALFGVLFLGGHENGRAFIKSFLSALELYRIHFQRQMSSRLTIEEVKETQIIEHDRMVVSAIKKKITPEIIHQVPGIRVSSFHMNNSVSGGDYFDTIRLSRDRMCIFMSDTSYGGIDSAILGLELYTVLHSQQKKSMSPERILNTMNYVISSTEFSGKYAPSICMTLGSNGELEYSDAAYNPLTIYYPDNNSFTTYETKGIPVGVDKSNVYESKKLRLTPGCIGMLFSDGFSSAINETGESYAVNRARNIILKHRYETPMVISRNLFADFSRHIENKKQLNDVTMIIFKVTYPESPKK
jgi:sigma-B regulation protein RsbU (phosphoserine phosphatase)